MDGIVPKPCPSEFRDDVVRVAWSRELGVAIEKIARDFGVHPMTLRKWMRRVGIDEGSKLGQTRAEAAQLREAGKRIGLLEQESEVLRRAAAYLSQANLPGKRCTRSLSRSPPTGSLLRCRWGDLPLGAKRVGERVLKFARQPYCRWLAAPITDSEVVEAFRANVLFDAHRDDAEFGRRLFAGSSSFSVVWLSFPDRLGGLAVGALSGG